MSPRLREDPDFIELDRRVRNIDTHVNADIHGRRIGNASDAKVAGDYVTKRQLDLLKAEFERRVEEVEEDIRTATIVTGGGPAPTVPTNTGLDYGYWIADGDIPSSFIERSHYNENKNYTNMYIAWSRAGRQYGNTDTPTSDWVETMRQLVERAFGDNRTLMLLLDITFAPEGDIPAHMDRTLDALTPYWSKMKYVDMSDDANFTVPFLEQNIALLKSKLQDRGLAIPKIGITMVSGGPTGPQQSPLVNAQGLDYVAHSAYVEPPEGLATAAEDEAYLRNVMTQAKARVMGAGKKYHAIMMGYARNGSPPNFTFVNKASLENLQRVTYDMCKDDPNVEALHIFSYGRESGTKRLEQFGAPGIKAAHQGIWLQLQGGSPVPNLPTCGGGGLPPECLRYCRGGLHEDAVNIAQAGTNQDNPAWFVPGAIPLRLLNEATANAYVVEIVRRLNLSPSIEAIVNPGDGKEAWTKERSFPVESEHWALWASQGPYEIRVNPQAYRATCRPPKF